MSLNGLDDPKIVEAHEAGVAEPGGWYALFNSPDFQVCYIRFDFAETVLPFLLCNL